MKSPPAISLEFFPPKTPRGEEQFHEAVDRLARLQPDFISLTYGAGGSGRETNERILRALLARRGPPPAAHLTCVGDSRASVDTMVRRWKAMGIRRLVALRGDMPEVGAPFRPHPDGYADSVELIRGLRRIGDFDISVGAYPETHPDASSPQADIEHLKRKIDAGANRAITQYFFDAEVFLRFRDRAARAGVSVPIVPGILPVFHFGKVVEFSRRCGATVPDWLKARFEGLDEDPETRGQVAAIVAAELCNGLREEGVDRFHFYALNRAPLCLAVCRMLGLRPTAERKAA